MISFFVFQSPDPGGSSLPESERDDDRLLYHDRWSIVYDWTFQYHGENISMDCTNPPPPMHIHTHKFCLWHCIWCSHAIQSQEYADLEDETLQVEQREREMRQLEVTNDPLKFSLCEIIVYFLIMQSDIVGINDIFRDLATLVNEQGEVIGKDEN